VRPRVAALLVVVAVVLGACGGGGSSAAPTSSASTPPQSAAPTSTVAPVASDGTSDGTASASVQPTNGAGGTGDTSSSQGAPPAQGKAMSVTAALQKACVAPGDTQTITITTRPESAVGYHAVYSDGKNGFDPDYYGGNKSGVTNGSGTYQDTWVVGVKAPPGTVNVDVVGVNGDGASGQTKVAFAVANSGGGCA
jgi:hypothetical protein